ncbi:MAG: GIY-YIG nuclease family protein, partial [Boseongicola sp. SB0676_bin_33]|nr:GIY-YIG nuclease family protein [Boseongicola sp. SB0676_bin_33]
MSEYQPSETNGQDAGPGIVYVLTNEAMPGLVKIGRTTQDDPRVRMDQLYNGASGVPVPFDCVLAMRAEDIK